MALRPIDLQSMFNNATEVARITQMRNDTQNLYQGQFALQLKTEEERKQNEVQKTEKQDKEGAKIRDESKRNQAKENDDNNKKKKKNLMNKEIYKKNLANTKKDNTLYKQGKLIDIRI